MSVTVEESVLADFERLPGDIRESGLAAGVLALARELDGRNSATSKAMCFKALQEGLRELRALAPPAEETDAVNHIELQRAKRLERLSRAADS